MVEVILSHASPLTDILLCLQILNLSSDTVDAVNGAHMFLTTCFTSKDVKYFSRDL